MHDNQLTFPTTRPFTEPSTEVPAGKKPLLISASRRTDLPGFYPDQCVRLIRDKVRRLRARFLYGVMFWSKQPLSFLTHSHLRALVDELRNPMLQLTITGLGSTPLEPGIPPCEAVLDAMPDLIKVFKQDPRRIRWRFDPILCEQNGISQFTRIANRMSELGIINCTISFPTYFSLKGNLDRQFEQAGIPKWSTDAQKRFLDTLVGAADKTGIALSACAQPFVSELQDKIQPATCIDAVLFQTLHPDHLPLDLPKDYSQRKHCHCVQSDDIGSYTDHPCRGECAYCYSKAGGPKVMI